MGGREEGLGILVQKALGQDVECHHEHLLLLNTCKTGKQGCVHGTDPFFLNNIAIYPCILRPFFVAENVMLSGQAEPIHATESNLLP